MPAEIQQFRCPVCGQHAPLDRLDSPEPFIFGLFRKIVGGKRKLTEAEREARRGMSFSQGSAPGLLSYEGIPMQSEAKELLITRLQESLKQEGA